MKVYRLFLMTLLLAVIAFGIWYVVSSYSEQRSSENGLLVKNEIQQVGMCEERENIEAKAGSLRNAGNDIY